MVNKLEELIEQHYKTHKEPGFYAEQLGCSLKKINEVLKLQHNTSISQMVQDRLQREAVRLVKGTKMSMKEITYELGIRDPAYFNRRFKQLTGDTPLKYRRKHKANYSFHATIEK